VCACLLRSVEQVFWVLEWVLLCFFSLLLGFYASILILLNLPLVFGAGILILMIFQASSSLGGNFVVF